jgi:hypothetical protein
MSESSPDCRRRRAILVSDDLRRAEADEVAAVEAFVFGIVLFMFIFSSVVGASRRRRIEADSTGRNVRPDAENEKE